MMSSSSTSSSAAVRVDKATSDLLIGPDWTMNMEICDSINSNHWQAKDVVKAVKKRLQHRSSTVQILALTLLETMVKNCGDYVHFQIVDRNILQDMVKIVRKKADTNVRNKILDLLDSWQEAFGGPGGKYPQYYWTYEELKRSGVQFPKRSRDAAPIFTPPVTHPPISHTQPSYGMPSNASTRLEEAMASEMESLSLSSLDAMGRVAKLLTDMLQAVNPNDREAVKDEVIHDLADQCRSNQKRLMQMLTSTGDEELLASGLELNDNLQSVLAKHDAIASGLPLLMHNQIADMSSQSTDAGASTVRDQDKVPELASSLNSIVPVGSNVSTQVEDVDDEEDDFAQLARRHSKHQNTRSMENLSSSSIVTAHGPPSPETALSPSTSNALVLADPPPLVSTTKEQDMIDILSLALTTSPHSPAPPAQSTLETPVSPTTTEVHPNGFQAYPGQLTYNNYIAPWAQPQPQTQSQLQSHPQQFYPQNNFQQQQQQGLSLSTQHLPSQPAQPHHLQQQQYAQMRPPQLQHSQQQSPQSHHTLSQRQPMYPQTAQSQALQQLPSSHYPQYSRGYIPPPWAATPGYYSNRGPVFSNNSPHNFGTSSYTPTQPTRPQQYNTGSSVHGDPRMSSSSVTTAPAVGQKPFIPSYRLFEDLAVFGHSDGRVKEKSSSGSLSLSGGPGQGMVDGNK
uniref:Uncharacterized protein n=1 Tax=Kalanchoe fedtschenkoi TaxID=63787 RepID=A0A7N1A017_KALFE